MNGHRFTVLTPLLGAILLWATPCAATPSGTLDKVQQSGIIILGIRESSYPLSYLDGQGQPIGYHMDICRAIAEAVRLRTGLAQLNIQTVPVTSANRIPKMVDGAIDLECGSTTNNRQRQKFVAFAPTTYVATVRTAVRAADGITRLSQLNGKTVVTTAGSTSMQLLKARQMGRDFKITEMLGGDHAESFHKLESGEAAGFVMDDNLLAGLIASAAHPKDFTIIGEAINTEPVAIMLRRDDPAFKALVDDTVKAMMKSGELRRLYAKWFQSPIPPKGINLNFPMSGALDGLIQFPGDEPAESFRPAE